jgi:hypothetical protein
MRRKDIIYKVDGYRICEILVEYYSLNDLMGDSFCPIVNPDIDPIQLKEEREEFIKSVEELGVYGYQLEKWNPAIDAGWEIVDSCSGFVGTHEDSNHYIVDEFKKQIEGEK